MLPQQQQSKCLHGKMEDSIVMVSKVKVNMYDLVYSDPHPAKNQVNHAIPKSKPMENFLLSTNNLI